jgi:hypothetical protein
VKYNVCVVRKFDAAGVEKTHYWTVGKAFSFETREGKKGINIKLYSRTLMVDEYVLFEDNGEARLVDALKNRPNQQEHDTPDDSDIPF